MDWSNVYLGAKNYYGAYVDMIRFKEWLEAGRMVTAIHFFSSEDPLNTGQRKFHDFLARNGYVVHLRELEIRERDYRCGSCRREFRAKCPHCGLENRQPPHKSKMIDIEIARYLLTLSGNYEEALLVSGDKDFLPVVDWLRQERGKRVVVCSWQESFSGMFHGHVDEIIHLDPALESIKR